MFFRLRRRLALTEFVIRCRTIFETPPIESDHGRLAVVSQVSHEDLTMYLLAVKSLHRRLGGGAIVVLDDGSLTSEDEEALRVHIRGLELYRLKGVDTGEFPRGGTWERLVLILRLSVERYVIQMDSDTLAIGSIDEVVQAYKENRGFLLGTRAGREVANLQQCAEYARSVNGDHVQLLAERILDQLTFRRGLRYVRASSGFAGFPRAGADPDLLKEFSRAMTSKLGRRWSDWGSEQVSSNFVLANTADAQVLPYPRYACFDGEVPWEQATFLHFIGPHRFHRGLYWKLGRRSIAEALKLPK